MSICIPTYNRPDDIKALYQSFLCRALKEYGNQIEVVVCDNSDDEHAQLNQSNLGNIIRYFKNDMNLGGDGNIMRCVRQATGQFIWIIPDDDLIVWEGFNRLMDCLTTASGENIDCLILPTYSRNLFGEIVYSIQLNDRGVKEDMDIATFVKTFVTTLHLIPFTYLASGVVRLNKKRLDWVENEFRGNIFPQTPLLLSMLKPESKLRFLDTPVIDYNKTHHIGFNILSFYNSNRDVILFLEKEYHVNGELVLDCAYRTSLFWVLNHRIGLNQFQNGDKIRWHLLAKLGKHLNLRNIIVSLMVVLPGTLVKYPYLFYLSLQNAHYSGNLSVRKVLSHFRALLKSTHIKKNLLYLKTK